MPQKKKKRPASASSSSMYSKDIPSADSSTVAVTAQETEQPEDSSNQSPWQRHHQDSMATPPADHHIAFLHQLDKLVKGATPINKTDCFTGIRRVDSALEENLDGGENEDLKHVLLLKRAQLLKIVFDKRYGSIGLAAQHKNPLDSCIRDCQNVVDSSSKNSQSSSVYQEALRLLNLAKKLKLEDDPDVHTRSGATFAQSRHTSPTPLYFDPAKTHFKDASDIHPALIQDIVNCYKKYKYVCRVCFVRFNRQEILVGGRPCRRCRNTSTIRIVPASKLCKNFRDLKMLAIPPPPKVLMAPTNRYKPFLYCRNNDHLLCYDRAKESWYAHSMDEIVIWTVERHYGCSFTEYVNNHHTAVTAAMVTVSTAPSGKKASSTSSDKNMDNIDSFSDDPGEYQFYPSDTVFSRGVSSIPTHLLNNVIKCYNERKEYCKLCFYKQGKKGELTVSSQNTSICKLCHKPWQSVVVIPASNLCCNFGDFDVVPIAPLPKTTSNYYHSTFKYCNNDDHYRCFRLYIENEFWYVHSVEEMVIWTVEKEKECTFSQFINKSTKTTLPPPGLTLPPSPSSPLSSLSPSSSLNKSNAVISNSKSDTAPPTTIHKDKDLTHSGGQSSTTLGKISSPSFSEVVSSGPSAKISRPPSSGGKFKPAWGAGEKEESRKSGNQPVVTDVDTISISSNNSGIEPVIKTRSTGLTGSSTAISSATCTKASIQTLEEANESSTSKVCRLSDNSYVTALSQDTNYSSLDNPELSQDSMHSDPVKSRTDSSQGTNVSAPNKSRTLPNSRSVFKVPNKRGRPNYKVSKGPIKNDRPKTKSRDEGPSSNLASDEVNPVSINKNNHTSDNVKNSKKFISLDNTTTRAVEVFDMPGGGECESAASIVLSQATDSSYTLSHSTDNGFISSQPTSSGAGFPISPSVSTSNGGFTSNALLPLATTSPSFVSSHQTTKTGFMSSLTGIIRPLPGYTSNGLPNDNYSSHSNIVNSNRQGVTHGYNASNESSLSSLCGPREEEQEVFKFFLVYFRTFSDIPIALIVSIATVYEERREVCRKCFFGERSLSGNGGSGMCSEGEHTWSNPVTVIPGCKECNNEPCFDTDDYIPLPPLPPIANIRKCSLKNHHKCFQKCLDSNPKFAHSVEQLVVWLIESEKDCSFLDFINGELQTLISHPRPDSTSAHHHINGVAPASNVTSHSSQHERQLSSNSEHRPTTPNHQPPSPIPSSGSNTEPTHPQPTPAPVPPPPSNPPHKPHAPQTNSAPRHFTAKYNARNATFEYIADIPKDLLSAVSLCFSYHKSVCRQCFFKTGCRQITTTKKTNSVCLEGHNWRSLTVMPGCRLCSNANLSTHIPVLPIPKHMNDSASPFTVCKRNEHQHCHLLGKNTNPWFPHTVEELVIWTVEREKSMPFEKVYKSYLPTSDSNITPDSVVFLSRPSSKSTTITTSGGNTATTVHHTSTTATKSTVPLQAHTSTTVPDNVKTTTCEYRDNSNSSSNTPVHREIGIDSSVEDDVMSENCIPSQSSIRNGNGTTVESSNQPVILTSPVSLFHDPLMYYGSGSGTGTGIQTNDNLETYDNNIDDTLSYFPALRPTVPIETSQLPVSHDDSTSLGNEVIKTKDINAGNIADERTSLENDLKMELKMELTNQKSFVMVTDTNSKTDVSLVSSQSASSGARVSGESSDHNSTAHTRIAAMPANWPDVQRPSSHGATKDRTNSSSSKELVISGANYQGQEESPPHSSHGSSVMVQKQKNGDEVEKDGVMLHSKNRTNDVISVIVKTTQCSTDIERTKVISAAELEAEQVQCLEKKTVSTGNGQSETNMVAIGDEKSESTAVTTGNNQSGSTTSLTKSNSDGSPTTSEPGGSNGSKFVRRDSLDVNAKEFTPRSILRPGSADSRPGTIDSRPGILYPTGLNPNAAVYPYPTNGVPVMTPVLINSIPTMLLGPVVNGNRRKKMVQPGVHMNDPMATTQVIPYPTSEISSSPSSSLSPPSSPGHPHKCFLCYQSFPDPPSLKRHCQTAAHISTLLRDCGAGTIWKNLPPPPGQPRELMKLCVNGPACPYSRLDCLQPHSADEFAEQLRRIEHHNKREVTRTPLPEFSDQIDGLLISPLEKITHYTTLKVSVGEPLHAVLDDTSMSFTWTITVQGQNWQTLFGIHIKSPASIFHITDLEDAMSQAEGNCQSDWANWVVISPANAILLGRLSFSVRATPDMINMNYNCRVCLNLGFYQYAYISLALVVKDNKGLRSSSTSSLPPLSEYPPPLSEYPPMPHKSSHIIHSTTHKRSHDQPVPVRPHSRTSLTDENPLSAKSDLILQKSLKEGKNRVQLLSNAVDGDHNTGGGACDSDGSMRGDGDSGSGLGVGDGDGYKRHKTSTTDLHDSDIRLQDSHKESAKRPVVDSQTDHVTSNDTTPCMPTTASSQH